MERADRKSVATFFVGDQPLERGVTLSLGADVTGHVRVLRLATGAPVRLTDGAGRVAQATILRVARDAVAVEVGGVTEVPEPAAVHLLVPVADRDRMLWLAEKSTELEATSWRPVLWKRSRSVSPRGEGTVFSGRVRARMVSAIEQSGAARLPAIYPEAVPERAISAVPVGTRIALDKDGARLIDQELCAPVTLVVGPEGGLETTERDMLMQAGFVTASLGASILRFETAAVAALSVVRAALFVPSNRSNHGQ